MQERTAPTQNRSQLLDELRGRFGDGFLGAQQTRDGVPTVWVSADSLHPVLDYLKTTPPGPYRMLFDLSAIDERQRQHREGQPESDFTAVYHLLSLDRNTDIRVKTPMKEGRLSLPTITDLWPSADWYEREAWDMFGVTFEGHPGLRRILMPVDWTGHPLRKEHPLRATEMGYFQLPPERQARSQENLRFKPSEWGLPEPGPDPEILYLNLGPHHPGTHGVFRVVLQLDGEEVLDAVPDIGYHHRAAEKMGEHQSWHTYIPYTDRVDYLGGVMNNLAYLLPLEQLAGIEVPERVKVIRVMLVEMFRISNHLVFAGTFAADVGMLSPVFYMFNDRERLLDIVTAITGGRMHPNWFRIGGVAQDLPAGWERLVRGFLDYMPARLDEYEVMVLKNSIFKARTRGVGAYTLDEAIDWGVTGANLRACGLEWDMRRKRPYSGYEQFAFDIPVGTRGDSYDRMFIRYHEMRQSLRIIEQCLDNMPAGPYKAIHAAAVPPLKERTMHDIETLIAHFLSVSWGPTPPAGEAARIIESTKGWYSYYLVSDGGTHSYRTRIRTPSFAHLQTLPLLCRGAMIPDVLAILGSLDYVMSDVDR